MDAMEASIRAEDEKVRTNLTALEQLNELDGRPDLETAKARWQQFADINRQVVALSRENTNVRSLSISLTRKRAAMRTSQDALATLQQAIEGAAPRTRQGLAENPRALDAGAKQP
jgi:putative heme degradation protein